MTRDDAAGGVLLDKVARAIGLGYPGGLILTRLQRKEIRRPSFSRQKVRSLILTFISADLKSAVLNYSEFL